MSKLRQVVDSAGARWLFRKREDTCALMRCGAQIAAGARCLYLPQERDVVCEPCGQFIMAVYGMESSLRTTHERSRV